MHTKILLSVVIGLICGALSYAYQYGESNAVDVFWSTQAATDLLHGQDPYRHTPNATRIPYPLPAALVVIPLTVFPREWQAALFIFTITSMLVFVMIRDGAYWRLIILLSPSFFSTVAHTQWSLLLLILAYMPTATILTGMAAIKPHMALPVICSQGITTRKILVPSVLVLCSLIIMPAWPWIWLSQLGTYRGFIPALTAPLGPLLLLLFLQWPDKRSQYLSLLALMPQYPLFYDQLLVYYCATNARSTAGLVVAGWIALFVSVQYPPLTPMWLTLLLYIPTLVIILSSSTVAATPASRI